jgi:hypothetical protein
MLFTAGFFRLTVLTLQRHSFEGERFVPAHCDSDCVGANPEITMKQP